MAYGDLIYGDGLYKGEGDSPEQIADIFSDPHKTCLILGLENDHGGGWSERTGENWIWPSSGASVTQLFDAAQQMFEVALDARDGLFYILNPIDGVDIELPYKDKVDLLVENSGHEIECDVMLGEVTGEMRHYNVYDLESHLQFRPVNPENFSKTGFEATGLPTDFAVDVSTRQDGKPGVISRLTDIPIGEDIIHERVVNGHSHQMCIHFSHSAFKLTAVEQYCKVADKPSSHDNGGSGTSEDQMQRELALPKIWISRGSPLFLNRATGRIFNAQGGTSIGPDLRVNSAFTLNTSLHLNNPAAADGLIMLWRDANVSFAMGGQSFFVNNSSYRLNSFQFSYYRGAISQDLVLPADVKMFDVRVYCSSVSVAAIEYYIDNVMNHSGDIFLP